jgi:N-carbamoylputrescine amidase
MKVTVSELSHEPYRLEEAWRELRAHVAEQGSRLVVLPELAFSAPLWRRETFEPGAWSESIAEHDEWQERFGELGADSVIGTRPVADEPGRYNEGFIWSVSHGYTRLRRKSYLPNEPGAWEGNWFSPGDREFPPFSADGLSFGLNICTELWALETYRRYAARLVHAIISPRATAAATTEKWIALGRVAAVASGAYCISSNRIEPDGGCGGVGWVIDPDGELLAKTSADHPCCTVDIDIERSVRARKTYPRYIFGDA